MKELLRFSIFLVLGLFASLTTEAKVTLPAIFSDNMVLQQNAQVNVWGKATPGEKVTVKASWADKVVTAKAAANGKWTLKLKNPDAMTNPFRTDTWQPDSYARWFADSEMVRFPQAYQLDHGKRLFFGYAQGVGCCAMLQMWKKTGERRYFDYVEQWADSLIDDKGEIHLYRVETYNLDYINSGKVLFDLYRETGKEKYKTAMDALVRQLKNHPRTLEGAYWHKLVYQHQIWLDGLYMASPFLAQYGAEFNKPEWIDEAVKQFTLCQKHTYDGQDRALSSCLG